MTLFLNRDREVKQDCREFIFDDSSSGCDCVLTYRDNNPDHNRIFPPGGVTGELIGRYDALIKAVKSIEILSNIYENLINVLNTRKRLQFLFPYSILNGVYILRERFFFLLAVPALILLMRKPSDLSDSSKVF